ncbi:Polysaccharide deacetylase [hydrothermal vent metagenome]|uniref:Polysaccharide deacetylase n=1 Tax=hydrothermal vent metagenome TaxID=652676 RepID=A0A1W1CVU5_9ZZZZ
MNILHLLSQTHLTGAEVYAMKLISKQQKEHQCFVISDTLNTQTNARFFSQKIDKRDIFNRVRNLIFLIKFCKKYNIDIIHSHSRAASWLAYYIEKIIKIKIISTIHGRQIANRKNIYGKNIITICENLKSHLINDLLIDKETITVIPNGFDLSIQPQTILEPIKIAWIGRLTGPKGEVIKKLADMFKNTPNIVVDCFGGPNVNVAEFNKKTAKNIHFKGQINNVLEKMQQYTIIFGSGRVAIEALFLGKIVYAIGESNAIGFITAENFKEASKSNFGDCAESVEIDIQKVQNDLKKFINNPQINDLTKELELYQLESVYQQVMSIYAS